MDGFILSHTRQSPRLDALRQSFIDGDPGGLLCVEFYADKAEELPARLEALEQDLRGHELGYRYYRALDLPSQAKIWSLREAALGLSMAMKEEAKSLSFVEDTAVAPEKLREYIDKFVKLIMRGGASAGIYAHASVGCLQSGLSSTSKPTKVSASSRRSRTMSATSCSNMVALCRASMAMGSSAARS